MILRRWWNALAPEAQAVLVGWFYAVGIVWLAWH